MADPIVDSGLYQENNAGGTNPRQQGAFGLHPLATPKYARNGRPRDAEYKDTLARIYVSLADASEPVRKNYLQSLPADPQTQALAQVLLASGSQSGFIDFFLQQVQETWQEVVQVDKVLGDNYVAFYFGQEPPVFQYSGTLLNSQQDDQRTGFALAYQHILRGTQLARRGALVRLRYDSVIVSGTINSHSQMINAENEMAVPFNFTLLVKEYIVLPNSTYTKSSVEDFVKLAADSAMARLDPVNSVSDARVRALMITPDIIEKTDVPKEAPAELVWANLVTATPPPDTTLPAPQKMQEVITKALTYLGSQISPELAKKLEGSTPEPAPGFTETLGKSTGVTRSMLGL